MNSIYFQTKDLSVGYHGKALIKNININVQKGEILTLIGPNGSGKSTILKSITKHLATIKGSVLLDEQSLSKMDFKTLSTKISVVLTERIRPELMSCYEVVATGRYPYTNSFGMLNKNDKEVIKASLQRVNALDLADKDFTEISDGQRQRIMLARAICQEADIIVLDEPTSFLDIKYKIELLDILREMTTEKGITVIMSLHEIDLAPKISDKVVCVKGDEITRFGTAEEIFKEKIINELYQIEQGSYNMLFGSVELSKPKGEPNIFIFAGAGKGINLYRELQKKDIPFAVGVLYENDVDYHVAKSLAHNVYVQKAFTKFSSEILESAYQTAKNCGIIINLIDDFGDFYSENEILINRLEKEGKKIYSSFETAKADFYGT